MTIPLKSASAGLRRLLNLGFLNTARSVLLPVALLAATVLLALNYQPHYPIQQWLVWRYLGYWVSCAGFTIACLSAGHRVLRLFGRSGEGLRDELLMSFGLGVLVFFWSVFVLGLLGLLNRVVFFALPIGLTLAGWKPAFRLACRSIRATRLKIGPRRNRTLVERTLGTVVLALGGAALLILYAQILSPENLSFDARWYHLGMAEQYVADGAIRRFPEGWYLGAYPQLASLLYTWAFLHPSGAVVDRALLAAHLEFTLFLWTLAGVSCLVRRLAPRVAWRHAWVSVFLFPGFYIYDSNLGGGAEHVLAFWAPLLFIALIRAFSAPSPRTWFVSAAFIAGACLTKYTAFVLVAFPLLAFGARCGAELVTSILRRRLDRPFWRSPLTFAAAGLVLTAPHWLKNWLWYGNPIYPMAGRLFSNRPWSAQAENVLSAVDLRAFAPKGTLAERLNETFHALFTFSFVPHDFPKMHGAIPVFGSLFTACLIALPFLRGTKRTWALVLAAHVGVFAWYWTHHEDRYLQALVPWMAAVVSVVVALAWRAHKAAKVGVVALVSLQVVWGADMPFYGAHAMVPDGSIEATLRLLRSGFRKDYAKRFAIFGGTGELTEKLPKDARILLHEYNPRLGFNRPIVTDVVTFQGGLHYGELEGPRALYDLVRGMGATHVAMLHGQSRGSDTYSGDLVFFDFLARYSKDPRSGGGFELRTLVDGPDEDKKGSDVLFLGCASTFEQGLYRRVDLNSLGGKNNRAKPRQKVGDPEAAARLASGARYVLFEPKCWGALPASVPVDFIKMASRKEAQIWVRKPAAVSSGGIEPGATTAPTTPDNDVPDDPFLSPTDKK